jgi:hypothetical protein
VLQPIIQDASATVSNASGRANIGTLEVLNMWMSSLQ